MLVEGSKSSAKNIIVLNDKILIHDNIEKITKKDNADEEFEVYKYEETQYTKDEFIEFLYNKILCLESKLEKVKDA